MKSLYAKGQTVKLCKCQTISFNGGQFELSEGIIGVVTLAIEGLYFVKFHVTDSLMITLKVPEIELTQAGSMGGPVNE